MEAFGILFGFIPLLILAAIIAGIVALVRHASGDEAPDPGIGTTRRVFLYGLGIVALGLGGGGLTVLLDSIVDAVVFDQVLRGDSFQVAFGIAATLAGMPVWLGLWWAGQRSLERYPTEAGALGRKLYVYLVLGVSAAVFSSSLIPFISDALGGTKDGFSFLAPMVVWGGVWAFHWRMELLEGQPSAVAHTVRRLYVYATSTYGLVMLASGVGIVIGVAFGAAYDGLFRDQLLTGDSALWRGAMRGGLASAAVGGAWWWFHWHRLARGDERSVIRQATTYVVPVFGGVVTVVASVATPLFLILQWAFAQPRPASAAVHFSPVAGAIAAAFVGTLVWGYHARVVVSEAGTAGEQGARARRVYRYLTSAVGLGTVAIGVSILLGVVIGLLVPSAQRTIAGTRWWDETLSTALTLLVVGTPLWLRYWSQQQRLVRAGEAAELDATSRRVYVFVFFGAAVIAALGALSTVLFIVAQAAVDGELSTRVLDGGKWAIGILIAAGAVSAYHWQVLREDRDAIEAAGPSEKPDAGGPGQVTVIAPHGAGELIRNLEERTGISFTVWTRRDDVAAPQADDDALAAAAEQLSAVPGGRAIILIDAGGVHVIPA